MKLDLSFGDIVGKRSDFPAVVLGFRPKTTPHLTVPVSCDFNRHQRGEESHAAPMIFFNGPLINAQVL